MVEEQERTKGSCVFGDINTYLVNQGPSYATENTNQK